MPKQPRVTPAAYAEWFGEQVAKEPTNGLPLRIQQMHRMYKATPDKKCGGCVHLHTVKRGQTWFKCDQSRMSASTATDWRKSWPACGKYEEGEQQTHHMID